MKLVGIAAGGGDAADGHSRVPHQVRRFGQPQADQIYLGRTPLFLLEQLAEIAAVEPARAGNFLYRKITLVM